MSQSKLYLISLKLFYDISQQYRRFAAWDVYKFGLVANVGGLAERLNYRNIRFINYILIDRRETNHANTV